MGSWIGAVFARHKGFVALAASHALVFWVILASGSPWATASLECATGGMADVLLSDSTWSPWDTFQGALGGMFTTAVAGLPLFAVLGVTPFSTQLLAYCGALALLGIVYALLDRHESRSAALVAVAGLAFAPPILFHPSAVLGNWHWTQLIFDYGLVLFALELLRRARPTWAWGLFGGLAGLAVFHCMGSLPFVGIAVLLSVLGRWPGLRRALAGLAGLGIGLAPFLYKLLAHRPFGYDPGRGDQTLARLTRFQLDFGRLSDLVYPELPWGLHYHDAMADWPGPPGWTLALLWVSVAWAGVALLVCSLFLATRTGDGGTGGRRIAAVPVLFIVVFVAAYVSLTGQLEMLPDEFTNIREKGHRNLPVLLAAMVVGAAVGWTRLAHRLGGRVRVFVLGVGLVPCFVGALGEAALFETEGPRNHRSMGSYRAGCVDALGVFAAASLKGHPWDAAPACDGLEGAGRQQQCRLGAAWGTGFGSAVLGSGTVEDPATGQPQTVFIVDPQSLDACDRLPTELVPECLFGIGWSIGSNNWGEDSWPIPACDSLALDAEWAQCWRGVGFPLGDHLHARPRQMGQALARAPVASRAFVAEGMGVAIGRSYGEREWALSFCDRMGGDGVPACRSGVERAFEQR